MRYVRRLASNLAGSCVLLAATGCFTVNKMSSEEAASVQLHDGDMVEVAEVIKGDEVAVSKAGKRATIRLLGLHAFSTSGGSPEMERYSSAAIEHLRSSSVGKKVQVKLGKTIKDAHGRYLGYLELDGKDLNLALIEAGLAVVYTEFRFGREVEYLRVESQTRKAATGLWADAGVTKVVRALRLQWADYRSKRSAKSAGDKLVKDASAKK